MYGQKREDNLPVGKKHTPEAAVQARRLMRSALSAIPLHAILMQVAEASNSTQLYNYQIQLEPLVLGLGLVAITILGWLLGRRPDAPVTAAPFPRESPVPASFREPSSECPSAELAPSVCKSLPASTREVATQSQTTYARHRLQPRFVPLSEAQQGAWSGNARLT